MRRFDAGLLGDFGGGKFDWWHGYIRSLLDEAYDFYAEQYEELDQDKDRQITNLTECLEAWRRYDKASSVDDIRKALKILRELGEVE